jgi:hypothetical protein
MDDVTSWAREHLDLDITFQVDDRLSSSRCAVSRDERAIWLAPDLEPEEAKRLVVRATACLIFGAERAPEFCLRKG